MLFAPNLCRTHYVSGFKRSRRSAAKKTTTISDRLLLSTRQISNWRKFCAIVRSHGRVQRKVSLSAFHYIHTILSTKKLINPNIKNVTVNFIVFILILWPHLKFFNNIYLWKWDWVNNSKTENVCPGYMFFIEKNSNACTLWDLGMHTFSYYFSILTNVFN